METVFGFKWKIASYPEIIIILLFFILIIIIFLILKYFQHLRNIKIHNYQLFLFRMKRLGLSIFQIKIINNMVEMLRLSNSTLILDNPKYFEEALGKFLAFLKKKGEVVESLAAMYKDIVITYEKLYHTSSYKKPLNSINEIEVNQLIYFVTNFNDVFFGKIIEKKSEVIFIQLFRNQRNIQELKTENHIKVYIWRIGDAEYLFNTRITTFEKNIIKVEIPHEFSREKEFRHPYLNVIIPASIVNESLDKSEEEEKYTGTLLKLNDYEAVIRLLKKLDYNSTYSIEFEVMDFNFKIIAELLANKTVEEENISYYTFKFTEISEVAKNILKKYIYEHL